MNDLTDRAIAAAFTDVAREWAVDPEKRSAHAMWFVHAVEARAAQYAERPRHEPDCPCEDCDIAASREAREG